MVDVSRVGWHTSVKWLLQQDDKFFEVHKVFQVMVGSPRTLQVPSVTDLAILMSRHPDITVVVHAPYVVSLCKRVNDRNYVNTLGYCIKFAKILDKIGIRYFVIHIGARSEDMLVKESALSIWNFCQKWLMSTLECNIHLCLENDSGSKKGTKMGYINVLQLVIRKVNDPRVRMTFDCLPGRELIQKIDGSYISVGEIWRKYNLGEKVFIKTFDRGRYIEKPIVYMQRRLNDEYTYYLNSSLGQMKCTGGHKVMTPYGIRRVEELGNRALIYSSEKGLTSKQKEVLYGTMAGDTCLGFSKRRVRLQLQQGEKQKEYLELKKKIFDSLGFHERPVTCVNKRNDGTDSISYKWCSKCNESLREIENICYRNGKRYFSKEWADKITPLGLAFWFYDDGNLSLKESKSGNKYRYATFHVQKFSDEEALNFTDLMKKYEIDGVMHKYEKGYQFLCSKLGTERLMELIRPYLFTEDMAYKHINPIISTWVDDEETPLGVVKVDISKKITNKRDKYVYDFEVEGTHTYFCHNYYVHNCEHAYGAGYDPTDETNLRKIEDIVDVVHWNSVPQNVVFGGHLDRHSTTSFYESKISPISQYRVLYNKERPFIFEVESLIYVKRNFEWLKENTNE